VTNDPETGAVPITIHEISVHATTREEARGADREEVDMEAFRRRILEDCERIAERAVRRAQER
jgi:hypothetical protein